MEMGCFIIDLSFSLLGGGGGGGSIKMSFFQGGKVSSSSREKLKFFLALEFN